MSDTVLDGKDFSTNDPIGAVEMLEGSQLHTVPARSIGVEGGNRRVKSKDPLSILKHATDRRQGQAQQRPLSQQSLSIGSTSHPEPSRPMGSGPHNLTPGNENQDPPQLPSLIPQLHSTMSQQQPSGLPPIKRLDLGSDGGVEERKAPAAPLGGVRKTGAPRTRKRARRGTPKPGLSLDSEDQAIEEIRLRMGQMDMGNNRENQAVSDKNGRPKQSIAPTLAAVSKPNIATGQTADTSYRPGKKIANYPYPFPGWNAPSIGEFKRQGHIHPRGGKREWDHNVYEELLVPGPGDY